MDEDDEIESPYYDEDDDILDEDWDEYYNG